MGLMRTDNNRVRDAICPPVSDRLSSSSTTHTATGISFQRQPGFERDSDGSCPDISVSGGRELHTLEGSKAIEVSRGFRSSELWTFSFSYD